VVKVNAMSYARLIKMLMEGTRTAGELAEETGLHKHTVYEYTRELHKVKAVHIADWEKDILGRECMPIFMIGNKPDAKRATMTKAQIAKNYRARKMLATTPKLTNWLHTNENRL
jgi:predicted ArsR family transcriptional regulator